MILLLQKEFKDTLDHELFRIYYTSVSHSFINCIAHEPAGSPREERESSAGSKKDMLEQKCQ